MCENITNIAPIPHPHSSGEYPRRGFYGDRLADPFGEQRVMYLLQAPPPIPDNDTLEPNSEQFSVNSIQ